MWMAVGLVCLLAPVPGEQLAPYAPVGAYAGHWGIDLAAEVGTDVAAPIGGERRKPLRHYLEKSSLPCRYQSIAIRTNRR